MQEFKVKNPEEVLIYKDIKRSKAYREKGRQGLTLKILEKCFSCISHEDNPFLYNMILNEIEVTQKKIFLESKPRQLGVNLTHNCNIRCRMCFYPDSPWDIPGKTAEEIKAYLPYLHRVFWQGGEPFVSPYFEGLFDKACSNPNLRQVIVTNGLLIDEKWAKKLVSNKVTIIYSVDGVTKETYEYIRSGARYENLIESLCTINKYRKERFSDKNLYKYDFELIMQTTIMKHNYQQAADLVNFARRYKFDALNIIPIQNIRGPENIFFHKDSEALEYLGKVLPELQKEAKGYKIRFQNQLPEVEGFDIPIAECNMPGKMNDIGNFKPENNRINNTLACYWPWYSLFILFEGRVKPYGFCRNDVEWNLADNSLDKIWNNKIMQTYREKIVENDNNGFCESRCTCGIIARSQLGLELK